MRIENESSVANYLRFRAVHFIVRHDALITRELTFILLVSVNEDALERERRNCDALRRRLSDFEAKAAQGTSMEPALADAKKRLHEAEAEVTRLKNALNKLKQQLQVLGISLRKNYALTISEGEYSHAVYIPPTNRVRGRHRKLLTKLLKLVRHVSLETSVIFS